MRKIDKLLLTLRSFGCDRWIHLVAGLFISWIGTVIVNVLVLILSSHGLERAVAGLAGVVVGIIAAFCKEVYDYKSGNIFDKLDLAASLIGIALFYAVYCV